MLDRNTIKSTLSGGVLMAALAYSGYAYQSLKDLVPTVHLVLLVIGFQLGGVAVARWVNDADVSKSMRPIKDAQSKRGRKR